MNSPTDATPPPPWNIDAARALYNIQRWGAKYFDINDAGHVAAHPLQENGATVDITDVIEEAKSRGLKFPLLIRFQDILRHRVEAINLAFRNSIAEFNYQAKYRGVFPIKVNQLREVVEEILDAGKPFDFGLEVGSKPELYAGLALQSHQGCFIICNGYKDAEFIRMALLGIKLGKRVIMVVEKLEELRQIIAISKSFGVEPAIGIRARLLSKGAGRWADSAGENAKFGLSTTEILEATEMLKAENLGHCLKLLHFHIGSQVPDILTVKKAVQEAARYYAKLVKMGFAIEYIDVGGGLGVDYDGSRTAFDSSTNYTLQEYTNDVVYYIADVCNAEGVPHPTIVSESGRAIVAHHSVLIVEVFGTIEKIRPGEFLKFGENEHPLVKELLDIRKNLCKMNKLEAYHDALERREDAQHMFTLGMMDLPDKAKIEELYWHIGREVVQSFKGQPYTPEEIRKLEDSLGDQYLCNFSVFQSLLDHWALGQLFPIMPVSRLNERPTREATLVDITCDSDGQVNKFIDLRDVRDTLPVHQLNTNGNGQQEPYYLGFFLMGAYQDIMGDLHNLFGRVNEVHIFLEPDEPAGYYIEEIIEGATIVQSLADVQYDENELKRRMKAQMDEAIKSDRMKPSEAMRLLDEYERGLKAYTYLSFRIKLFGGFIRIAKAGGNLLSSAFVFMDKPAPNPQLLRSLGKLARGLSALFWGLPATLLISAETARADWIKPLGLLPLLVINTLLLYGLWQMGEFQKQERPWRLALDRALLMALVNLGLCPFLYWHNQAPGDALFTYAVMLLELSAVVFLFNLNLVLKRLAAMLPDEALRQETRQFTALNRWLLVLLLFFCIGFMWLTQMPHPALAVGRLIGWAMHFGTWVLILPLVFFILLPLAMTMALIWKTKEVILDAVFGTRN